MKKVIIASTNPVKVRVAAQAFSVVFAGQSFDFTPVKSESGVPDQPMNEETRAGARNRLDYIRTHVPDADYWISQEGGLFDERDRLYNRAWIAVTDTSRFIAESSTALFYLPKQMTRYIKEGMELGLAADKFFSAANSKQGSGAIGHLTGDAIDRTHYYLQAAIIALSELKHKDWYQ